MQIHKYFRYFLLYCSVLQLSYGLPLVKRATISWYRRRGRPTVIMIHSVAWVGVAAALCNSSSIFDKQCWIGLVGAAVLSAVSIVVGGETSGSTASGINSKRGLLNALLLTNVTDTADLSIFTSHPIISEINAFVVNIPSNSSLVKRSTPLELAALKFKSNLGNHFALSTKNNDIDELASAVSNATPGIPSALSNKLTGRDDTFDVKWISYNFDNINRDLTINFEQDAQSFYNEDLSFAFNDFVNSNPGWKWCINLAIDDVPNEPVDDNHKTNIETAIHGELYLNTYGGIDNQCNEAYDCLDGKCSGTSSISGTGTYIKRETGPLPRKFFNFFRS